MYANGSLYMNKEKWYTGNRVRWFEGYIRPIGGWRKFQTNAGPLDQLIVNDPDERCRAILAWKNNGGNNVYAAGTNKRLLAWDDENTSIVDITPVGFIPRGSGAVTSDGYGFSVP